MTYSEALENIHSLLSFGSRPGLDRVSELLRRMGNPQDKLRYIHVAGTNGKGSTCAMLSAILKAEGYKTGLFISPYITDFRERIQINNVPVSEETLTDAVEETLPLVNQLRD
ncbi:MAG: bifunctional folylpolyglutamate synthase/dihydrofolate synthase, partial [Eubacteriales bacterium]|nr:bifunctional folylpolyglutamate synthase/dihydrofolate synthase [Eubacteriales bacterium]